MRIVSDRDFIVEIEDVLDAETCAALVAAFDASLDVRDGRVFHMHRGNVPESSDKYVISSFCEFPRSGPDGLP